MLAEPSRAESGVEWSANGEMRGAVRVPPSLQVFITAFLGAFAAAKGVRTLRDAAAGRDGFEIAGGSDIKADL
jgi:hypothetical protein